MRQATTYVVLARGDLHEELARVDIREVVDAILGIVVFARVGVELLDNPHVLLKDLLAASELQRAARMAGRVLRSVCVCVCARVCVCACARVRWLVFKKLE